MLTNTVEAEHVGVYPVENSVDSLAAGHVAVCILGNGAAAGGRVDVGRVRNRDIARITYNRTVLPIVGISHHK